MKVYRQIPEDAEYREYYDSYRITVDNLNDTDFLYKTSLSNGQVFFKDDEVYGYVNNQAAVRGRNITITKEYVDNFVIRDFKVFTRATNEIIDININCNLKDYRDEKPHYLYIILSHRGKYEVYDDMFQSDETKVLFARFIVDKQGNSLQFYIMLPFAGSADYLKGNQFFQVTEGLRVKILNNKTKQLTLSKAKIRFSGINFDDMSSPDCIEINHEGNLVPIRYVKWNNTDNLPRVVWTGNASETLNLTKVMDYSTGSMSTVPDGKFSVQKLYYDVYERCIIALYGDKIYDSRVEAIYGIDRVLNYTLPDGIEYLIPIACVIAQNTSEDLTSDNFRVVNLDYNEQEVLDSDTFTRQQSAEAVQKAREALDKADYLDGALTEHTGDRTNPHRVRLNQMYNSRGEQVVLADDYADYSVSSILSAANANANDTFYKKTGGEISGSTSITGALTVRENSQFKKALTIDGNLTLGNNLLVKGASNIGSVSSRINTLYGTSLDISDNSIFNGQINTSSIIPITGGSSDIGSSSMRYRSIYTNSLDCSGSLSGSSMTLSGKLSSGSIGTGTVDASRVNVNNGYLVVGGYSLRLGSTGSIPTSSGYALV